MAKRIAGFMIPLNFTTKTWGFGLGSIYNPIGSHDVNEVVNMRAEICVLACALSVKSFSFFLSKHFAISLRYWPRFSSAEMSGMDIILMIRVTVLLLNTSFLKISCFFTVHSSSNQYCCLNCAIT